MEKFEKIVCTIMFIIAFGMFLGLVGKFVYAFLLRDEDVMWISFMAICVITCLWVVMITISCFISSIWTSKKTEVTNEDKN